MKFMFLLLALISISALASAQCADYSQAVNASEFRVGNNVLKAGDAISGAITLQNSQDFALPDSVLVLQIVRPRMGMLEDIYGADVVDEQQVGRFALPAHSSKKLDFSLIVPAGVPTGDYEVRAFVSSASFSTGGAPYRQGSQVGTGNFHITNEAADYPLFNRTSLIVAGSEQVLSTGAQPIVVGDGNFSASFDLANLGAPDNITVQYLLYYQGKEKNALLDALQKDGAIPADSPLGRSLASARTQFDVQTIPFAEGQVHKILIKPVTLPPGLYLVEAVASKGATSSRIEFQVLVPGEAGAIDFASLSPIPPKKGEQASVSACIAGLQPEGAEMEANLSASVVSSSQEIFSGSAPITLASEPASTRFGFTPESAGGRSLLALSLYSAGGSLLDIVNIDYNTDSYPVKTSELNVRTSLSGTGIAYRVTLSDADGNPLAAQVGLVLKDAAGNEVGASTLAVNGSAEGAFKAPEGGYVLEASAKELGLSAKSANSTPYSLEAQFEVPLTEPQQEQQAFMSNPFALLGILVLLVLLVGLGIFAMRSLGGGKKREFDSDWDKI